MLCLKKHFLILYQLDPYSKVFCYDAPDGRTILTTQDGHQMAGNITHIKEHSVWAVFGVDNITDWNFIGEMHSDKNVTFLTDQEVDTLRNNIFLDYKIESDLHLELKADNKNNPSKIKVIHRSDFSEKTYSIYGTGKDITILMFYPCKGKVMCISPGSSNTCSESGTLRSHQFSTEDFFLRSAELRTSSSHRVKYNLYGSHYRVMAKLADCPTVGKF